MKKIYSQFVEFGGRGHVTYHFKPGSPVLPCEEGAQVKIIVIGKYSDDDVDADIVKIVLPNGKTLTHQNDGKRILHITRATRNGVAPVQSGIRATEKGWKEIHPFTIRGTACYFTGK